MKQHISFFALIALGACSSTKSVEPVRVAQPSIPSETTRRAPAKVIESTTSAAPSKVAWVSNNDASSIAKPWINDALQIRDPAKREAAITAVREALVSSDQLQVHAGLIAFNQMRSVYFDKPPFRPLVLPHLASKDGSVRLAAMYALDAASREQGDLERILAAAEGVTGEDRHRLVHVIATYSNGELTGAAGEAVSKLIASDERGDVRQALSGLWGTRVSPEIEKRLLDMSNGPDRDNAHDAIYFGLSTLRDKSEAVVDRLVAALEDPDHNNSGRALWGLGQGVPPALQPKVADAMLQLLDARSDPQSRERALRLLSQYGVERHAAALESLAAGSAVDAGLRRSLLDSVAEIRRRDRSAPK